jgi:pantoate--beta-alanine ligase
VGPALRIRALDAGHPLGDMPLPLPEAAAMSLPVVRTVAELRETVGARRRGGERVGLVPTMGALHEGHLSLVRLAKEKTGCVIASVFVNPTQFAPNEDFDAYPRDEARDAGLLASAGCDLLWAPTVGEMYPDGFATTVTVTGVSAPLEGEKRPTHFQGVATVVAKLLNQVQPDVAVFGEKDYQQLMVIRRMARDLDLPVEIVGAPTARAPDGLALSSRNAYLDAAQRETAGKLNVILAEAARALAKGARADGVEAEAVKLLSGLGFDPVDYVEVRDRETLERLGPGPILPPARLLAAAWLGRTRLIDNVAV